MRRSGRGSAAPVEAGSMLRLRDQLAEALDVVRERPWRAAITSIGIALGVGSALATLVVADTARHQVSDDFDALRATQVLVSGAEDLPAGTNSDAFYGVFPPDADSRLSQIAGVVDGGVLVRVEEEIDVRTSGLLDPIGRNATRVGVTAATPGALKAAEIEVTGGVWDPWHEKTGARVALLGRNAAKPLGIAAPALGQVIYVDGMPFALAGVIETSRRDAELLRSVVVPTGAARALWRTGVSGPARALVRVHPGAAAVVADQAPLALRPDQPALLAATTPPEPRLIRQQIESSVQTLFFAVAGIALLVGGLGIANTTLVAVLERQSEYALRRALGARPSHLMRHVITDTATIGLLSGALGVVLGMAGTLVFCTTRSWVPIVDPRILLAAPLTGAAVGALAGLLPAWRVTRIDPAIGIRT